MSDKRIISEIIEACVSESRVAARYINASLQDGVRRLSELGEFNLKLANESLKKKHMLPADDFIEICADYVRERFGDTAAADTVSVMKTGILEAADHLGGFYSPQSLQGNILYADMVRKVLPEVSYVPMFCCGIVPVQNTANPRGIVSYEGTREPVRCNIIPRKYHNVTVTGMTAYSDSMLDHMRKQIRKSDAPAHVKAVMTELADDIYARSDVMKHDRYAEQMVRLGTPLTQRMLRKSGMPAFIYMENEMIFSSLIAKELKMGDTFLCRLLSDSGLINAMNDTLTGEERHTFSNSLFVGLDERGWRYLLNLESDHKLHGYTFSGEEKCFDASFEELIRLMEDRVIFPSVLLQVIATGFERGLQWSCGIFASEYIPEWQKRMVQMLAATGRKDLLEYAGMIEAERCSSYISGPIFMLCEAGKDRLANAAVVELCLHELNAADIARYIDTSLYDGNLMGIYEFYNDIVPSNKKVEGWYDSLMEFFYEKYKRNTL